MLRRSWGDHAPRCASPEYEHAASSTGALDCKEIVFSVEAGDKPDAPAQWFTASSCKEDNQQDNGWKWASAEPAVERWGNLQ